MHTLPLIVVEHCYSELGFVQPWVGIRSLNFLFQISHTCTIVTMVKNDIGCFTRWLQIIDIISENGLHEIIYNY